VLGRRWGHRAGINYISQNLDSAARELKGEEDNDSRRNSKPLCRRQYSKTGENQGLLRTVHAAEHRLQAHAGSLQKQAHCMGVGMQSYHEKGQRPRSLTDQRKARRALKLNGGVGSGVSAIGVGKPETQSQKRKTEPLHGKSRKAKNPDGGTESTEHKSFLARMEVSSRAGKERVNGEAHRERVVSKEIKEGGSKPRQRFELKSNDARFEFRRRSDGLKRENRTLRLRIIAGNEASERRRGFETKNPLKHSIRDT